MENFTGTAAPLTHGGFEAACSTLGADAASLWALLSVETRACGFFSDRRPQILFERHIFHKRTAGRFDRVAPDISNVEPRGYAGGTAEYARLSKASGFDTRAALESASWGLGQVMGFHAVTLKYSSVEEMVSRFCESEDAQLDGVQRFISANAPLSAAFKAHDWTKVAFFYNGSGYAANQYDQKLARFHQLYSTQASPDIDIRAAQVRLAYLGIDPHGVDGVLGPGTRAALLAFQAARRLPQTADLDAATRQALTAAAGV